jgi:peptidyl-prolyl cis-trans isomerase C
MPENSAAVLQGNINLISEIIMAKASARHILVETSEQCEDLKGQIEAGADFADLAAQHSKCPSGQQGGALGEFSPGQMVPEFDKVVFAGDIEKIHGPIQTQFGFHLIEITSRTE